MAVNRDPMKGRHSVGGKTATPGATRGGQGAHAANGVGTGHNQKTGVNRSSPSRTMQPKPGVLTNQAETSLDLQRRLSGKAPQPFTNTKGAATAQAPTQGQFRSDGNARELQTKYGGYSKHSVHAGTSIDADMMAAVGYGPSDTRSSGSIISGFPTKGIQRQAGRPGNKNTGTSSRENARMRQTGY